MWVKTLTKMILLVSFFGGSMGMVWETGSIDKGHYVHWHQNVQGENFVNGGLGK